MARVIAGMTVSLDGFVADSNGSAGALYPDLAELQDAPYMTAMQDETGAALMGRRTFEMAEDPDGYADSYELQVPIFVVTHTPPSVAPKRNERLFFTFVTDGVQAAVAQAVEAAGERAVTVVGGADLTRQLLEAGLVDELRVDVMPVLLGAGLRLFDGTGPLALARAPSAVPAALDRSRSPHPRRAVAAPALAVEPPAHRSAPSEVQLVHRLSSARAIA